MGPSGKNRGETLPVHRRRDRWSTEHRRSWAWSRPCWDSAVCGSPPWRGAPSTRNRPRPCWTGPARAASTILIPPISTITGKVKILWAGPWRAGPGTAITSPLSCPPPWSIPWMTPSGSTPNSGSGSRRTIWTSTSSTTSTVPGGARWWTPAWWTGAWSGRRRGSSGTSASPSTAAMRSSARSSPPGAGTAARSSSTTWTPRSRPA